MNKSWSLLSVPDSQTKCYTMAEIAEQFFVHYMTVSRAVRKWERGFE